MEEKDIIILQGATTNEYAYCKLYSLKLWNNHKLVRAFVPVKEKATAELGLYDIINNEFYGNDGSGKFTTVLDFNRDCQRVEYIESNGTQ